VQTHTGNLTVTNGARFAVVVARFNDLVTKLLMEGAVEGLKRHGAEDIEVGRLEERLIRRAVCRAC
jgi:6,7-dimethyl-8-ribityllumazine synthase